MGGPGRHTNCMMSLYTIVIGQHVQACMTQTRECTCTRSNTTTPYHLLVMTTPQHF